jgi:tetratricopeptide (TPR) repeat protein
LIGFIIIFLLQSQNRDELLQSRDSYLIPLKLESSYIDKGETYINLAVIDIRLNNFKDALEEARLAGYNGRTEESQYLEAVIYYLMGDKEKAISNFSKINRWKYPYFLEQMIYLSAERLDKIQDIEIIPDSLRFYTIFFKNDANEIESIIKNLELPLWQKYLGEGYFAYKRGEYKIALNHFTKSYKLKAFDYTALCIIATEYWLGEIDSLLFFIDKYSIISPLAIYLKAEIQYEKGNYDLATNLFLSVTNSQYKTHALYGAAWGKYRLEQYRESIDLFQRFLNIYKNGELRQFALYRLARSLLKLGEVKSIDYFEKIIKEYPESQLKDDTYLLLGKIHLLLENLDESISYFKRLISEYPGSKWIPYSYEYLGSIFVQKKEFKEALNYYSSILNLEGVSEELIDETRYRIEEIKWKIGKYPTRLSMLKEFIRMYPQSPRTPSLLLKVGDYYNAAARYERAIFYYNKILNDYSNSKEVSDAVFSLSKAYLSMGETDMSIQLLEEILLNEANKKEEIHLELAEIYYKMDELEKAIHHYREISSANNLPYALYQMGSIYFELGLFREARIPLEQIINNFPESKYSGSAYLLIGETYLREGSLEDAVSIVDEGINILSGKEKSELIILKARIFCQMHNEEALDVYLKGAELMGEDINNAIRILEDGLECAKRLNIEDKIEYFQKLIDVLKTHKESD